MTAKNRIVILWRLFSSPTAAAFPSKMHCLLLLLGLLALASFAQGTHNLDYYSFNKRGPVQPSELCGPGGKGNGDIVCAPTKNDNYTIPNVMTVAWNSADGEVASINAVDIYLRRTDKVGWVGKWPNIPNEERTYSIQLDEKWFPDRKNDSIPQTLAFQIVIVPFSQDPNSAGPGTVSDVFYITRPADANLDAESTNAVGKTKEPSTTTRVVTNTPDAAYAEGSAQIEKDKSPSTALVIALAVSGVLALAAIIAVIFACKSRRRLKKHRSMSNLSTNSTAPIMDMAGKEDKIDPEFTVEVSSIHSTTPLATKESATTLSSMPSRSNLSSVPSVTFSSASQNVAISPSDASILSDAFRHALRKPDWENENNDDDEEEDDASLNEEERRRRKEAKQLMKMELAQEGTGLQTVQRRPTHVQIRKPTDEGTSPAGDSTSDGT